MSQLRSNILSKWKHYDIEQSKWQFKWIYITVPIQPNDNNDISQELEEPSSISDNEISSPTSNNSPIEPDNPQIEPDNLPTEPSEMTELIEAAEITGEGMIDDSETSDDEEHWSNVVEDWIETLDLENRLENGEIVSDEPPEFEFCGRMIHPADDPLAKWNLSELFDDSLDAPISFVF